MQFTGLKSEAKRWASRASTQLLFIEVDGFVLVAGDAGANLRGRPAGLGLVVSVEAFSGTNVALGGVGVFVATVQAGVAKGAVAAAVAWELVDDAGICAAN